MPKGFLVKRRGRTHTSSGPSPVPWRRRRRLSSVGSRSDSGSGSDPETAPLAPINLTTYCRHDSPDSGYSHSPVRESEGYMDTLAAKEREVYHPSPVTKEREVIYPHSPVAREVYPYNPVTKEREVYPHSPVTKEREVYPYSPVTREREVYTHHSPRTEREAYPQNLSSQAPREEDRRQGGVLMATSLVAPPRGPPSPPVPVPTLLPRPADRLNVSAPLSVATCPQTYPSPFYFPSVDRLGGSPKGGAVAGPAAVAAAMGLTHHPLFAAFSQAAAHRMAGYLGVPPPRPLPHISPPAQAPASPRAAALGPAPPPAFAPNTSPVSRKRPHDPAQSPGAASTASPSKPKTPKKSKAIRKIAFDEDKSSPVSGTFIKVMDEDDDEEGIKIVSGDIDSSLNFVDVTPEARAELDKIENKIGDYICRLCREQYGDAFQLAQHKCSRILHVEYRCPECDKLFSCPANLASHRRWHKPRPGATTTTNNNNSIKNNNNNNIVAVVEDAPPAPPPALLTVPGPLSRRPLAEVALGGNEPLPAAPPRTPSPASSHGDDPPQFECELCGKRFRRQAYLRKHRATHGGGQAAAGPPGLVPGEDTKPHPCALCSKVFRSDAALTKHLLAQHPPMGSTIPQQGSIPRLALPCAPSPPGLSLPAGPPPEDRPMLYPAPDAPGTAPADAYPCKYCHSVFYSSPGLTRHINKCHPSENRHVVLLQLPPVNRNS